MRAKIVLDLMCAQCLSNLATILDKKIQGWVMKNVWIDMESGMDHVYLSKDEEKH